LGQLAPQSTVGSMPFSTPSLQVGTAHFSPWPKCISSLRNPSPRGKRRAAYNPLQASATVDVRFVAVEYAVGQLVGWQMPFEQLTWSQSAVVTQCWLAAQRAQPLVPPQSMSVSS